MAIKFTRILVSFSNTTNKLLKEYHQIYSEIMSMKIKGTLPEAFEEMQRISIEIRKIQKNFHNKFSNRKQELPEKWKIFGVKLGEHLDAAVEHTHINDELIDIFHGSTWSRIWKARKVINLLSRLNKSVQKSSQKGAELNQLIESGLYNNP